MSEPFSFELLNAKMALQEAINRNGSFLKRLKRYQRIRIFLLIGLTPFSIGVLAGSLWIGKISPLWLLMDCVFICMNITSIVINAIAFFKATDHIVHVTIQQQFYLSVLKDIEDKPLVVHVNQ